MAVSVTGTKTTLLNSIAAATVVLPLWAGAALAQETQTQGTDQAEQTDQAQQSGEAGAATEGQQVQGQGGDTGQASGEQQAQQAGASDTLIATIGDAEIRNSDLMRAIGALPPELSGQPPAMLVPMALQQLLLREAIVQAARSQALAEDPEVLALVAGAAEGTEEDALVQVWLDRELGRRVPYEAVDRAYAEIQAGATGEVPPLEQIRSQIEQALSQQAMNDIQAALLTGADITLYGPDGQPMDLPAGAGGQGGGGGQADTGGQSGDAAGGEEQSQDNAAGGEDATGEQSTGN